MLRRGLFLRIFSARRRLLANGITNYDDEERKNWVQTQKKVRKRPMFAPVRCQVTCVVGRAPILGSRPWVLVVGRGGMMKHVFDVDDGNGKEEEGDEGAEGAGRAGECPADTPAAVYRSMRDASEFQDEKIDRRQNRWDQFFIQRENEWKEQVRTAYDEAAIVADREEQLLRENAELRAKISKLEAPSHAPPSPLVE